MNVRPICSVDGCDQPVYVVHRGLCVRHNARFVRHGSTQDPRPERFGEKRYHPLWRRWIQLRRRGELVPSWRDDFWRFAADISPKPENTKKLRRLDDARPFGPDNFEWAKTPTREETLAYLKAYQAANPDRVRASHFKNKYGITIAQYDAMSAAQNHKCAVCGGAESRYGNGKGRKRLAVDHDHATGAVRGLLCQDCNVGAGAFRDDSELLRKAADYIDLWRAKPLPPG
jgi:Recombination endonuclease VII